MDPNSPTTTVNPKPPPPAPATKVIVTSGGSHRNAFILGALAVFLLVGLAAGIYLVREPQIFRGKATGCDMRWPAKPDTACGQSTQSPVEGTTITSLTPNFHWDYGGYRTEDNGQCVQPSGCTTYSVSIYLTEGSSSQPFARANSPNSSSPVKDLSFSDFKTCDYGHIFPNDPNTCHTDGQPAISALKPNTSYTWFVTPFFDGTVHAEQTWSYHFKTPAAPTAACQMVLADKDLTKINIGDTVKFTGFGSVSSATEKIDKIEFVLLKDGSPVSDATASAQRAPDRDSGTNQFYVATQSAKIDAAGSYSMKIKVHWQSADQWLE